MPNHLMIVFDDMFQYRDFLQPDGKWGLAPYGIEVSLPNLARLEARSTQFRRAMAPVPVCGPCRAATMSGYAPAETGIFTNNHSWRDYLKPEHIWTYQIRKAGHYMGTVGKVFHGYVPQPEGVYQALYDSEPFNQNPYSPSGTATEWGGRYGLGWDNEVDWYDVRMANNTADFLLNTAPSLGRSWHWECGFHHPHNPWNAPNRIMESIDLNDIVMPQDWPLKWELLPFAEIMNEIHGRYPLDTTEWTEEQIDYWKKTLRNYIACIIFVDEQVGKVLDALESSPFNDDTIITCWSDHGYHFGDKSQENKFTLWEEACVAPLLISAPGQTTPGPEVWTPVSFMDIGATVCDYLGVPYSSDKRGVSLRPLMEGGTMPERLIPSYHFGGVSGAVGDYRITAYQDGTYEYYNVMTDPWLTENAAGTGDFETHRELLHQVTREWGMQLVEQGQAIMPGSPHAVYLGWEHKPGRVTSDFTVIGDIDARGASPGYQKMWVEYVAERPGNVSKTVRMPPGVEDLESAFDASGAKILANGLNNNIMIRGGTGVEVHMGDGDDHLIANTFWVNANVIAYGGRGNDTISGYVGPGNRQENDTLFGGEGDDLLYGQAGDDYLSGDGGNDIVYGGSGNDTIIASGGSDMIYGHGQVDLIRVTGGSHVISGGPGDDTFEIRRTGLPQIITDLASGDTLDLSDWSGIQPVSVVQDGSDVIVSAALERIICQNADAPTVSAAITGAMVG